MSRRLLWSGLLLSVGCAATVGPVETYRLQVPANERYQAVSLRLTTVDDFDLTASGSDVWQAAVTTNVPALQPSMRLSAVVAVSQKLPLGRTMPAGAENRWQATIGTVQPLKLDVVAASLPGDWRLGGLPLTGLTLSVGVAAPRMIFDRPNPVDLGEMTVRAGVGDLRVEGLGYAGPRRLRVEGGSGDIWLDFAGPLRHRAQAEVVAGVGPCTLVLPAGTPARLHLQAGVGELRLPPDYRRQDETVLSPTYRADQPHWDLSLQAGVGGVHVLSP